jgi:hypothetical protein
MTGFQTDCQVAVVLATDSCVCASVQNDIAWFVDVTFHYLVLQSA